MFILDFQVCGLPITVLITSLIASHFSPVVAIHLIYTSSFRTSKVCLTFSKNAECNGHNLCYTVYMYTE